MLISSIVIPKVSSTFFYKRMKQKSCIEGISDFPNPHRKRLPFFLFTHNLMGIDQNRLALSVKCRLAIKIKSWAVWTFSMGLSLFFG